MEPVLQPPALEALATWLDAHDEVAPGVVEGLYVVGSAVLGDWTSHSDIDVVVVRPDSIGDDHDEWATALEAWRGEASVITGNSVEVVELSLRHTHLGTHQVSKWT